MIQKDGGFGNDPGGFGNDPEGLDLIRRLGQVPAGRVPALPGKGICCWKRGLAPGHREWARIQLLETGNGHKSREWAWIRLPEIGNGHRSHWKLGMGTDGGNGHGSRWRPGTGTDPAPRDRDGSWEEPGEEEEEEFWEARPSSRRLRAAPGKSPAGI